MLELAEFRTPDQVDMYGRAAMVKRLELWVGVLPVELSQYHPRSPGRRADLLGQIIQATERRAVLCTEVGRDGHGLDGWAEDLWRFALFDAIDVDEWNERVCARCRGDAPVRSEEGIWWCGRHATRAWEPIEHARGKSWQEQRFIDVGE